MIRQVFRSLDHAALAPTTICEARLQLQITQIIILTTEIVIGTSLRHQAELN